MNKDHQKHILFVKGLVDEQPAQKRIEIYRWLADLAGDQWTTKQLQALANELETTEHNSRMFDLEFSAK
jgi:hypothetical protein